MHSIKGLALALALAVSGTASAADLGGSKDGDTSFGGYNWSRCGVSLHGAYSMTNTQVSAGGGAFSLDGLGGEGPAIGIGAHCDTRLGDRIVAGAFLDYSYGEVETTAALFGTAVSATLEDSWTIGARIGFLATQSTLIYGLGGYSWLNGGDISANGTALIDLPNFQGWTFGGGLETALGSNSTASIEYRYTAYDSQNLGGVNIEPDSHTVMGRVRLNLMPFGG